MARNKVKLNSAGVRAMLQSVEMHRVIQDLAERVAENVKGQGIRVGDRNNRPHEIPLPVEVEMSTTDRARGVVLIDHAAGMAVQAKHGVLTKAASQAGLKVKSKD